MTQSAMSKPLPSADMDSFMSACRPAQVQVSPGKLSTSSGKTVAARLALMPALWLIGVTSAETVAVRRPSVRSMTV